MAIYRLVGTELNRFQESHIMINGCFLQFVKSKIHDSEDVKYSYVRNFSAIFKSAIKTILLFSMDNAKNWYISDQLPSQQLHVQS